MLYPQYNGVSGMSDENIHTEFPTYNGMNRPAMFFGVPLMPMVLSIIGLVLIAMIGQMLIGKTALLLVGLNIPIYFGLKTISENDDQAIKVYAAEAKWLLRRIGAGAGLSTFTLHAGRYGRHRDDYKDYQRLLEQDPQQNGIGSRFSPEDLPTRQQ
jgi:hypothetical protein